MGNKYAAGSEVLVDMNRSSLDIEAHWLHIHRPHCKDVVVCNVYRPPSGNLDKAVTYLNECVKSLDLSKVEIFIMSDMNVNYKNKVWLNYQKLKFFTQSNGLSQLISTTTRNTDKTNSLLDLILTNSKYVSMAGTLEHYVSDHQPVYVVKKKGRDVRPNVEFRGRSYRNFDKKVLTEKLLNCNWEEYFESLGPEIAWDYLMGQFIPLLDEMCPVRTFQIKNYRPD